MKTLQTVELDEKEIKEAIREYILKRYPESDNKGWSVQIDIGCREVGPQKEPYTEHTLTAKGWR